MSARPEPEASSPEDLAPVGWSLSGVTMQRREVFSFDPTTRASRYEISIPVRYRPLGELGWIETKTINISCTGVLFETDEPLQVESPVELSFDLPVEIGGAGVGELTCLGQVVRSIMPPSSDAPLAAAAAIADFKVTQH